MAVKRIKFSIQARKTVTLRDRLREKILAPNALVEWKNDLISNTVLKVDGFKPGAGRLPKHMMEGNRFTLLWMPFQQTIVDEENARGSIFQIHYVESKHLIR
jgi:hypothetical protein